MGVCGAVLCFSYNSLNLFMLVLLGKNYIFTFFFFFPLFRALMDCLVLPIQNKLEEWKKITHALDKEHAKGKPLAYYLGNDRVCNFYRVWRSLKESDIKEFDRGCQR